MSATTETSAKNPKKKRGKGLLLGLAAVLMLCAGGAGAYLLVPGVSDAMRKILPGGHADSAESMAAATPLTKPVFVELPEMTVTLPNGGRPRQLRLKLAVEVATGPDQPPPDIGSPRVYDSLVLYLRTLRDAELEGALAMDRLRGDLLRRLDLLLGDGRVRDVLITGFVVA